MREYAWYSPELNVIVFQIIMDECYISFEWAHVDLLLEVSAVLDLQEKDPMSEFLWVPLGEL